MDLSIKIKLMKTINPFLSLFLATAVIIMTLVFSTFYFSESPWDNSVFQSDSEALVTRKIRSGLSILDDFQQKGGFLYAEEENVSTTIPGLYTSQVGLQGLILNAFKNIFGLDPTSFIGYSRIMVSLCFASTMAVILYCVWIEFGIISAITNLALIISAFWIVAFSKNLYWAAFTLFLPFAIGWFYYPKVIKSRNKNLSFLFMIGVLIFFKSLNGYEYITNVILGATIAPIYYELGAGTKKNVIIQRIVMICLAGVAGFMATYGLHFLQLYNFTHDLSKVIYILTERAIVRTLGENPYTTACDYSNYFILLLKYMNSQSIFRTAIPLVWMFSFYLICITPLIPFRANKLNSFIIIFISLILLIVSIGVDWFAGRPGLGISQIINLSFGFSFLLYGILSLKTIKFPIPDKLAYLAYSTTWALVSSFAWVVLARNHMACHIHLNPIVFYLPFGVTLFMFIGYWIDTLSKITAQKIRLS